MNYYISEIKKRMLIILITIICIIIIMQLILNKIILFIINPLCTINIELYNKIIYKSIELSFNVFDTKITENMSNMKMNNYTKQTDYLPSFEISLPINKTQKIYIWILMWIIIYVCLPIVLYQTYISIIPSLYKHEKKKYKYIIVIPITILFISILITNYIYMPIYVNYSFHNYQEYNFYEIDVDFNIESYLKQYIETININILNLYIVLLTIKTNKKNILLIYNIIIIIYDLTQLPTLLIHYCICNEIIIIKNLINSTNCNRLRKSRNY